MDDTSQPAGQELFGWQGPIFRNRIKVNADRSFEITQEGPEPLDPDGLKSAAQVMALVLGAGSANPPAPRKPVVIPPSPPPAPDAEAVSRAINRFARRPVSGNGS